jgi:hypothetical protein
VRNIYKYYVAYKLIEEADAAKKASIAATTTEPAAMGRSVPPATREPTLTPVTPVRVFILEPSEQAEAAIGKRVTVVDYPDGRLAIRYRGIELAYRTFDKIRQVSQAAIVENKQLGAALAFIREQQLRREPQRRSGPRRRDQHDARLFKVRLSFSTSRAGRARSVRHRERFRAPCKSAVRPQLPRSDISKWQKE